MTDAVLGPKMDELLDDISVLSMDVAPLKPLECLKELQHKEQQIKVYSCAPLMGCDVIVKELDKVVLQNDFILQSYTAQNDKIYIPDSQHVLWLSNPNRILIACVDCIHIYSYPDLELIYTVHFDKTILEIKPFKYLHSTSCHLIAILFKDNLQAYLYALPLTTKLKIMTLDTLMYLSISPTEYPTCIDCIFNYIAIGYRNGDVAVFKLNKIPSTDVRPFLHISCHTSIVSHIELPLYLGLDPIIDKVISSGLDGNVIYSEFSSKQLHGGLALNAAVSIKSFTYLNFIDGVAISDYDDSIKYATSFSRTESKKYATVRGGVNKFASSDLHPFLAMGGCAGSLVLSNTNHTRVKHSKMYIYCHSLIKSNEAIEYYNMNLKQLPKEAPPTLRVDGTSVYIQESNRIDSLCWALDSEYANILFVLSNHVLSILKM